MEDYQQFNNSMANITAAAGVIAAAGETKAQRAWQDKMYQRSLADQRQDVQEARMYNESMYNQYYSPTARFNELKGIGVNPNTAAEHIAGVNPSQPIQNAMASPSVPQTSPSNISNSIANLSATQAQTALQQAQTKNLEAQTKGLEIENEFKGELQELTIEQAKQVIEKSKFEINEIISRSALNEAQKSKIYQELPYLIALSDKQVEQVQAITANYVESTENLRKDRDLLLEKIKTERSSQNALEASVAASSASARLSDSQVTLNGIEKELDEAEKNYKTKLYEAGVDPDKVTYDVKSNPVMGYSGQLRYVQTWSDVRDDVRPRSRSNLSKPNPYNIHNRNSSPTGVR